MQVIGETYQATSIKKLVLGISNGSLWFTCSLCVPAQTNRVNRSSQDVSISKDLSSVAGGLFPTDIPSLVVGWVSSPRHLSLFVSRD